MTLIATGDIISDAAESGVGVGAFNVIPLEYAEAIVAGAEQAGLPVIVQISQNTVAYHGALGPVASAALACARAAAVPAAVHLDHATAGDLVREAIGLGIGSVMFDASVLPYDENVAATARVAEVCHAAGVWLEAELGEIGGKDGAHAPGARTDPDQAAAFVAATGVDGLAVAVGSSHAMTTRTAVLDTGLIAELRAAVPVPLVLHGSSGVPDVGLASAVKAGITKVNIATHLNVLFTSAIVARLGDQAPVDPRKYLGPARDVVAAEVARLLAVLRLTGEAG
jgi:fructose-bisphosphate aldolase, class II